MTKKLLFKYRALEPWDFFLDILINNRLYAAKFTSLNDPMEGIFTYSQDRASPSFIAQMINNKAQFGICSLSKIYNSTLMWSYYAQAHKGVVLGVEVSEVDPSIVSVSRVTYSKDNVFKGFLGSDPETEARKVLSKKLTPWKHEKEVRVFSRTSFVSIYLKSVYLGYMMDESKKSLVRQLVSKLSVDVQVNEMKLKELDRQIS